MTAAREEPSSEPIPALREATGACPQVGALWDVCDEFREVLRVLFEILQLLPERGMFPHVRSQTEAMADGVGW